MDAGTLNCPACGAAVSRDSVQCAYCHAQLQTVACPQCMGMMFAGTKFCPHCGAAARQVAPGAITAHVCPRCNQRLTAVEVARTPLEECMHCGGLWVDVSSFDHICADAEAQTAASGLQPPPMPGGVLDGKVRYLKCPQCQALMNRKNYAEHSGIVLNVCRNHGVWLDRDEMRQVIVFVRSGGLDRARHAEMEELERTRASLASQNSLDLMGNHYTDLSANDKNHFLLGLVAATSSLFRN